MRVENVIAFATEQEPTGLEIRVNFGVFAGRDATSAELEELGKLLVPEAGEVSIVGEQRHEISEDAEVVLHQVRISLSGAHLSLAGDGAGQSRRTERVLSAARDAGGDLGPPVHQRPPRGYHRPLEGPPALPRKEEAVPRAVGAAHAGALRDARNPTILSVAPYASTGPWLSAACTGAGPS